jgi:chemotaxis protein methyltransferase CheR
MLQMLTDKERPLSAGTSMSPELFEVFSRFISTELGIKMPNGKRTMLQSRLQKRLRRLKMDSFEDYYAYVFESPAGREEIIHLMDVVTTNKTEFFREPRHYDVLVQTVVPDLLQRRGAGIRRPLKVWSAGCSTGAEPYTLAMVLSDLSEVIEGFRFQILATDISTRVLEIGRTAVYEQREARIIPPAILKKYALRSKDRDRPRIRIIPELRHKVEFRRLNLMEPEYGMRNDMDIILCRNVIIYFDRPTQHAVLQRICHCLKGGGYLFMGHSETLNGLDLPLRQVAATVYQKMHDA